MPLERGILFEDQMRRLRFYEREHPYTEHVRGFLLTPAGTDFHTLTREFPDRWSLYLVGGVPRDLLLERQRGVSIPLADVDVVVDGAETVDELRNALGPFAMRENHFGGLKCRVRERAPVFDVWRAQDHINVGGGHERIGIERLLRHFLIDVDAVALETRTMRLFDLGCTAALEIGRIDMLGDAGVSPAFAALQGAHVLLVQRKTGFSLSPRLCRFVAEVCAGVGVAAVMDLVERKHPAAAEGIRASLRQIAAGDGALAAKVGL